MALRLGGFPAPRASFTVFQDPCHSPSIYFCRQPADRISDHKRTTSPFSPGDQQLLARHSGIYPAFIITFDVIRRVTGHSFFMKYRYPAMLHTMPKNLVIFGGFVIGLILMVSIYGVLHARRVYVRQDPVVIEKSSSSGT